MDVFDQATELERLDREAALSRARAAMDQGGPDWIDGVACCRECGEPIPEASGGPARCRPVPCLPGRTRKRTLAFFDNGQPEAGALEAPAFLFWGCKLLSRTGVAQGYTGHAGRGRAHASGKMPGYGQEPCLLFCRAEDGRNADTIPIAAFTVIFDEADSPAHQGWKPLSVTGRRAGPSRCRAMPACRMGRRLFAASRGA